MSVPVEWWERNGAGKVRPEEAGEPTPRESASDGLAGLRHVAGLRPFRAVNDLELDRLAFLQ